MISALQGGAGAGGVMFALAANYIIAHRGVILNPHYRLMGLHGSEYWTHFLPMRVGKKQAKYLTESKAPISASYAKVKSNFKISLLLADMFLFSAWKFKDIQSGGGQEISFVNDICYKICIWFNNSFNFIIYLAICIYKNFIMPRENQEK